MRTAAPVSSAIVVTAPVAMTTFRMLWESAT